MRRENYLWHLKYEATQAARHIEEDGSKQTAEVMKETADQYGEES